MRQGLGKAAVVALWAIDYAGVRRGLSRGTSECLRLLMFEMFERLISRSDKRHGSDQSQDPSLPQLTGPRRNNDLHFATPHPGSANHPKTSPPIRPPALTVPPGPYKHHQHIISANTRITPSLPPAAPHSSNQRPDTSPSAPPTQSQPRSHHPPRTSPFAPRPPQA